MNHRRECRLHRCRCRGRCWNRRDGRRRSRRNRRRDGWRRRCRGRRGRTWRSEQTKNPYPTSRPEINLPIGYCRRDIFFGHADSVPIRCSHVVVIKFGGQIVGIVSVQNGITIRAELWRPYDPVACSVGRDARRTSRILESHCILRTVRRLDFGVNDVVGF